MENLDDQVWPFLQDDRFIKWVRTPDEETNMWWERWMAANPEEVHVLFRAREIARDLAYTQTPVDGEVLTAEIWSGIEERLDVPVIDMTRSVGRKRTRWYVAAACLTGLALAGAGWSFFRSGSALPQQTQTSQQVASLLSQHELQRKNGTASNQQVYLVDGTKITLQPGAGIRHALFLQKDKREVYLEGNAFFEIAKDASRPFYVYTKDLVVRVLGTSFKVVTDNSNGDVAVMVETGKVAVTRKSSPGKGPLILEHNQQALYKAQTQALIGGLSDKAFPATDLHNVAPAIPFNFDETPVVQIFKKLESAYGIPLHYDEKTFSACSITTSLEDETFEEKLQIICEAIGAVYRMNADGVWIEGHGCK